MKRVLIPVVKGQLCQYFGQSDHFEIFEIDNETVINEESVIPSKEYLTKLPDWASLEGITDIVVHRIDKRIFILLAPLRINVFVGIPLDTPRNIIKDYINGRLRSDEGIISEILD